jgi:hypothetical protein
MALPHELVYKGEILVSNDNTPLSLGVSTILQEFNDVFLEEVPVGLPPLRGIEHQIDDTRWPSDTSASRPSSPPRGPMTRARDKAIHDKVNLFLNTVDLEHRMNGSLPHCNVICAVRYEPHGATTKDKEHEEEA